MVGFKCGGFRTRNSKWGLERNMGRRPIGDEAMIGAERKRKWRARRREAWLAEIAKLPTDVQPYYLALGGLPTADAVVEIMRRTDDELERLKDAHN